MTRQSGAGSERSRESASAVARASGSAASEAKRVSFSVDLEGIEVVFRTDGLLHAGGDGDKDSAGDVASLSPREWAAQKAPESVHGHRVLVAGGRGVDEGEVLPADGAGEETRDAVGEGAPGNALDEERGVLPEPVFGKKGRLGAGDEEIQQRTGGNHAVFLACSVAVAVRNLPEDFLTGGEMVETRGGEIIVEKTGFGKGEALPD